MIDARRWMLLFIGAFRLGGMWIAFSRVDSPIVLLDALVLMRRWARSTTLEAVT